MATELTMPQMGYDMQEGTVVRWLKSEGSPVQMGEAVAEIETDKAVVEFESYGEGVLLKILVAEGTTVPVGEVIALVGAESEAPVAPTPDEPAQPEEAEEQAEAPVSAAIPLEAPAQPVSTNGGVAAQDVAPRAEPEGRLFATPAARKIAEEQDIDLRQIEGTGPGGRITKEDVLGFADQPVEVVAEAPEPLTPVETAPEPPVVAETPEPEPTPEPAVPASPPAPVAEVEDEEGLIPFSRMRQQIARVTVRSKSEKPHFYVTTDIDMTQAMTLRSQINQSLTDEGVRVTVNDLIVKACVLTLKKYPKFNGFYQENGIKMNDAINIGVAIAIEEGLIVPALLDCGDKSLKELAAASKDLAERSASGTLSNQEYAGGTFAISNLGMFGVSSFIAIIQPPQTAVLAVGAVAKRPVVGDDDQITVAQIMTTTISGDHRIVDGAEGAQFVNEVKRLLENPLSMLV
ncbi:MAG: dihydrolipoamide acetyltransferase family protein [SAR202 cluster bacterium]|nr:dihydrolipoamide acetyltransferase family protein [SAR202 cluster bacterium]MDP6714138.1 dihydrolipoamide acetyltransferase family protein [SAR202 cluster bacterium]